MNESVALLVLGGLLLGVERPKESGFEISAKGDRVTVKGEGFELHASRIRYDQNKGLLICDQGLLSIMEPLHTQHTISCTKVFYNVKDGTYRVEGLAYPGGVLTFPH